MPSDADDGGSASPQASLTDSEILAGVLIAGSRRTRGPRRRPEPESSRDSEDTGRRRAPASLAAPGRDSPIPRISPRTGPTRAPKT